MTDRIGFMQGRLSPMVGDRIQAFPWQHWRDEFPRAEQLGISTMEWTLDKDRLRENPLLTTDGQREIASLRERHGVSVPSLTGDCFMQAPFWKATGANRESLLADFRAVADACARVGIDTMIVPLVDNGRLEDRAQEDVLVSQLEALAPELRERGVRVAFESDYAPAELARFIDRLDPEVFGINYDMGNSAALGFDAEDELARYGARVTNVHVKDRVLGGTTVPLGTGNANFDRVFAAIGRTGFRGTYILQTARAANGDHAQALARYRDMTLAWMQRHGA